MTVDSLIAAAGSTPGAALNTFSSYSDNGTISFHAQCFGLDRRSSISPEWSRPAARAILANHGGALITPQDVICANHWPYTNGSTIYFVDASNGLHSATVAAQANVSGTDIQVAHLSTALTGVGIKFYKVLPANAANFCPDYNLNLWPIVIAYNFGHHPYVLDAASVSIGHGAVRLCQRAALLFRE